MTDSYIDELLLYGEDESISSKASALKQFYEHMAKFVYNDYEPAPLESCDSSGDFLDRMERWLSCYDTVQERWIAFKSVQYLIFLTQDEYRELYRVACHRNLPEYIIKQKNLSFLDQDYKTKITEAIDKCWFCPITDSLKINSFLHQNKISGKRLRPDLSSLSAFAAPSKIQQYIYDNKIDYLVAIEDFVGSGDQALKALEPICNLINIPILFIPLVICEKGLQNISSTLKDKVTISPIMTIDRSSLISKSPNEGEPITFKEIRKVIDDNFHKIESSPNNGKFGYNDLGGTVIMYSNAPNNMPAIYNRESPIWAPLFPRIDRG
ncbi:phosphoribosyltransferase-like protein [Salinibius halmophilus]|uniref:phosphoribosyltransferase-like protein n=1 Tax=Salinibius halmophilus TaxID=1853216 RepID=UPI000E665C86|nr:hypothetical protein [Salinibius halmophilus]